MSIEERFTKIMREMDAELVAAQTEIAQLKSKLRTANFPTEQATECGDCGKYKHTPWRVDGGPYICASCFEQRKNEEVREVKEMNARLLDGLRKLDAFYRAGLDEPGPAPDWLNELLSAAAAEPSD